MTVDPYKSPLDYLAKAREDGWSQPQPLPSKLPAVPRFEAELLPSVLSVSAQEISETTQAPLDFVAAGYMVALSSLVARHIAIRPKAVDEWAVVPNLWGLIVGRPSAKKTPAFNAALSPLDGLEDAATEQYDAALAEYDQTRIVFEERTKHNRREIGKLMKKTDAESHSDRSKYAQEITDDKPTEPVCTRYIANDTTVEKLADLMTGNPSILVCRDELQGFFASLERHGQEGARSFYLEAWSGDRPFKVDRIGRGSTRIPRACVSVLGGIQPGPMGSLMRELQRNGRSNDGLVQRFQIAVWPDLSSKFMLVDAKPNSVARGQTEALFESLATLDLEHIGASVPDRSMPYLRFANDAQEVYSQWLEKHENRLRNEEMPECLEAHLGKYPSLVPSIALVLHLAEGRSGPVWLDSTMKAIAWAKYLEEHAKRIYAPIIGADFVSAQALAQKIRAKKLPMKFRLRDVYRHGWASLSTADEARVAADILEAYDWIQPTREDTNGRIASFYFINPLIWEEAE